MLADLRSAQASAPEHVIRIGHQPANVFRPADDDQGAIVAEVVVVGLQGVRGVEVALGEAQPAAADRGPRVHEAQHDEVELLVRALDEVAPLAHHQADLLVVVEVARPLAEAPHAVDDQRVELHCGDLRAARPEGQNHVGSAARPDDHHPGLLLQAEGEGSEPVAALGHALRPSVPGQDVGPGVRVDEQPGQVELVGVQHRGDPRVGVPVVGVDPRLRLGVQQLVEPLARRIPDGQPLRLEVPGGQGHDQHGDQAGCEHRPGLEPPIRLHRQQQHRGRARQHRDGQDGRLRPQGADRRRDDEHPARRPHQVGEVQPVGIGGVDLEGQAHRRPARGERQQAQQEVEVQPLRGEGELQDSGQERRNQHRRQQGQHQQHPASLLPQLAQPQ